MRMILIATHCNSKGDVVGYRVMNKDDGKFIDVTEQQVIGSIMKGNYIEGLELNNGKLKGTNGSIDRYTKLLNKKIFNKSQMAVVVLFQDDDEYLVAKFDGSQIKTTTKEILSLAKKLNQNIIANGKIVDNKFISPIAGTYEKSVKAVDKKTVPKVEKKVEQVKEDIKPVEKKIEPVKKEEPKIEKKAEQAKKKIEQSKKDNALIGFKNYIVETQCENSLIKEVDPDTGLTVEEKMIYAENVVKKTRPFYYYIFCSLEKKFSIDRNCPTMGVSLNTLYVNPMFIKNLPLPELVFALFHEICHIAMQHVPRMMRRDMETWNYAVDYYVNKHLEEEFNLPKDYSDVFIKDKDGNETRFKIRFPNWVLDHPQVNLRLDTPEKLYNEIMEETSKQQQGGQGQGQQGNGQQGQESGGQGQQNGGQQSGQDSGQSGSSGDSQQGQGGNQQGNGGQQSGQDSGQSENLGPKGQSGNNQEQNQNGQQDGESENQGQGNNGNEQGQNNSSTNGQGSGQGEGNSLKPDKYGSQSNNNGKDSLTNEKQTISKETTTEGSENFDREKGKTVDGADKSKGTRNSLAGKIFRGQKLPDMQTDMFMDSNTPVTYEQAKQKAESILNRSVTLAKKHISGFGGDNASYFERQILESLAPKINWRNLLRNMLTLSSQKINTFAAPDKRFRSRGMIMPGPKALDPDTLESVKVCIDTSGSISDEDLGKAMNQINQLLKTFHCKAELLYWDTRIRSVFDFDNIDELLRHKPMGGGGTDANCIFDYFETNHDYKIGRKKKPNIIIVFTDGCFDAIDTKYKKYKNTIWVVDGDMGRFKPPFGKVAPFKIDND